MIYHVPFSNLILPYLPMPPAGCAVGLESKAFAHDALPTSCWPITSFPSLPTPPGPPEPPTGALFDQPIWLGLEKPFPVPILWEGFPPFTFKQEDLVSSSPVFPSNIPLHQPLGPRCAKEERRGKKHRKRKVGPIPTHVQRGIREPSKLVRDGTSESGL